MDFDNQLVSVIVRTKDRPDLLHEALNSIMAQSHKPIEVLVVNDGGCDINDVISQFTQDGVTIKLFVQKNNVGRSVAGNIGLQAATGRYLMFLDDDDWFDSQHVSILVNALQKKSEYLVAYTGVRFSESHKKPATHIFNTPFDPIWLMLENTIPIHALLFDRKLLDKGCKFDEQFNQFEDWDLWLQFSCYTDFFHIDQVSAGYRSGGQSHVGWGNNDDIVTDARQKLIEKWKSIWSAEQLDNALQARLKRLQACHKQLGQAMEAHKILHEEYQSLLSATETNNKAHQELSELHTQLIISHQELSELHTQLIDAHQFLEKEHSNLLSATDDISKAHQELIIVHNKLATEHQALQKSHYKLLNDYKILNISHDKLTAEHQVLVEKKSALMEGQLILQQENFTITTAYQDLERQFFEVNNAYTETLNSRSWKYTKPIRAISNKLKGSKIFMWFYLKVSFQIALIHKISDRYRQGGLRNVFNRIKYHLSGGTPTLTQNDNAYPENLPNHKTGIVMHVFYTDLFEELCSYLNNIPIPYQLLISVVSNSDRDIINKKLGYLNGNAKVTIKVVPNRGRDIAPVLVVFRKEILNLDVVAHIHTKKSNYTGSSQFGADWRKYLLKSLLGSEKIINSIFEQFSANPEIGLIYPETFQGLPYWAHTWLSNRYQGGQLLQKLGYNNIDFNQYINYPVGSMFWAKSTALAPLLNLNLSIEDFPEESGQTDNTLHHAVERCFVFSAKAANLQYRFIKSQSDQIVFKKESSFVIEQYTNKTLNGKVQDFIAQADVVSFDIFDTLLIRPFADPDAMFLMLEQQIVKRFALDNFFSMRKTAEALLRGQLPENQDVSISQIYKKMEIEYKLAPELVNNLKNLEITTEQSILKERKVVVEIVKAIKTSGKRVILISDMYLEKEHINMLLDKKEINIFDEIYISSDTGHRKDQGTMWQIVLEKEQIVKEKLLHIGDNEHSDIQILVDEKFISPIHILKPIALLDNIHGGQSIISLFRKNRTWQNELMLGLIANKVSSHIDREPDKHETVFEDPYLFGYSFMGPIVFSFMAWLIKTVLENKHLKVLFLSREGWLLNILYKKIANHPKIAESKLDLPESNYFYCSRSFVGLAAVEQPEDLEILLSAHYSGTFENLLVGRFGIDDLTSFTEILGKQVLTQKVKLPEDHKVISGYLIECLTPLNKLATCAKEQFYRYWQQQVQNTEINPAIVDIGYSGTIQKAMMKTIGRSLTGYYFITNSTAKTIFTKGGQCHACYGNMIHFDKINQLVIHRYSLLLEAILTSPEGQMKGFKNDLTPTFKKGGLSQDHFNVIEKIHQGIVGFSMNILDITGSDFAKIEWEKEHIPELVSIVINQQVNIGSLSNVLFVEDDFCGNQELSVLDFYKNKQNEQLIIDKR